MDVWCDGPTGVFLEMSPDLHNKCEVPSRVWFFATPWTVACQDPLTLGFSRQEYWSGLQPFPPPGYLPYLGVEPRSLTLQAASLPLSHQGNPFELLLICKTFYFSMKSTWKPYQRELLLALSISLSSLELYRDTPFWLAGFLLKSQLLAYGNCFVHNCCFFLAAFNTLFFLIIF